MSTPSLDLTHTTDRGVDVVTCRGSLDLDTSGRLREVALACAEPALAVDLTAVDFLDSRGVATLVQVLRSTEQRDAELVLVCADAHLLKLLRISRLDTLVRVVADVGVVFGEDEEPQDGGVA
jgi:anti-sigma B factor antagonist